MASPYYAAISEELRERIDPGEVGGAEAPTGSGRKDDALIFGPFARLLVHHVMHGTWQGKCFRIVDDTSDDAGAYDKAHETFRDVTKEAIDGFNRRWPETPLTFLPFDDD